MNGLYVIGGGLLGVLLGGAGGNPALGLAGGLALRVLFPRTNRLRLTAPGRNARQRPDRQRRGDGPHPGNACSTRREPGSPPETCR